MSRSTPLTARAVVASGVTAKELGRRLAQLDDDSLHALAAVASDDLLVVFGDEAALPWIDGVSYLGRDESAPDLLLPTVWAPSVAAVALEAAIRKRLPRSTPVAVLPSPPRLIDCSAARAIDREHLLAWVGA
jgi:hypothetical protein